MASLFLRQPEQLTREVQHYLNLLCEQDAHVGALYQLPGIFTTLVRERRGAELDAWLKAAQQSGSAPLRRFAARLCRDLDAVRAGLSEP